MPRLMLQQLMLATVFAIAPNSNALAHCFVGNRFFPATLIVDDPCVADEMSLPTVSYFRNGDDPSVRELDISGEYSKRITDTFGISVGSTWTQLRPPAPAAAASGFQNLESSFKFQFLTDPDREFVMSASLDVEWGHTGSAAVSADPFTTLTPTLFLGKGFGELPDRLQYLKPFANTLQVGYSVPTQSSSTVIDPGTGLPSTTPNPQFLVYGGSLQYSMPYLKSSVMDLQLPEFINHLIPIVEWRLQTQMNNFNDEARTTGTINPGVIWVGNYYQVGVEAVVPVNRASGVGVGAIAQLHIYLDDLFPTTIGKPLFANSSPTTGRPPLGN
jgi:hypothetical protein